LGGTLQGMGSKNRMKRPNYDVSANFGPVGGSQFEGFPLPNFIFRHVACLDMSKQATCLANSYTQLGYEFYIQIYLKRCTWSVYIIDRMFVYRCLGCIYACLRYIQGSFGGVKQYRSVWQTRDRKTQCEKCRRVNLHLSETRISLDRRYLRVRIRG
jgi:hypothetical protein